MDNVKEFFSGTRNRVITGLILAPLLAGTILAGDILSKRTENPFLYILSQTSLPWVTIQNGKVVTGIVGRSLISEGSVKNETYLFHTFGDREESYHLESNTFQR